LAIAAVLLLGLFAGEYQAREWWGASDGPLPNADPQYPERKEPSTTFIWGLPPWRLNHWTSE